MFAKIFGKACSDDNAKCSKGKLRGFKLTTTERGRKLGVAANSLKILKKKAAEKLNASAINNGFKI